MIRSDYLHYFLTVAKYNSINSAAIELNVTPPAVSHAIKKLEDELNLTLFTRSPQGVALTTDGEIILPLAKEVILSLNQMESTAKQLSEKTVPSQFFEMQSCIFFSESALFAKYLPSIAKQFYISFPNTDLIISDKPLNTTLQTINDDIYSFATLLIGSDIKTNIEQKFLNIAQVNIISYRPAIIAKKNSKWLKNHNKSTPLTFADIINLPIINVSWNSTANYTFNNLFKPYGTPNIINIAPNLPSLESYLENDIGISLGIENQLAIQKNHIVIPLETNITFNYTFLFNKALPVNIADTLSKIMQNAILNIF